MLVANNHITYFFSYSKNNKKMNFMTEKRLSTESGTKKKQEGLGSLFTVIVAGMLLLGLLLFSVLSHAQITLTYSQSFTSGVIATTQCTAWETYRASLSPGYTYSGFSISGSNDPVGITCTDPHAARVIADSLHIGHNVFGITSDGHNWFVQDSCSGAVELGGDVPGGGCSCSPTGYSVRPCFSGGANWGGINGPSCSPASQVMTVKFFVVPVSFNNGPAQSFSLCANTSTSISSLLTITDGAGDTETWTVSSAPAHGTIGGLPATAPSDTNVTPAGVTYTPTPGYTGTDVFTVQVNNGFQTATTTISVTVSPAPNPITGSSSVCTGNTVLLTETTGGGTWASSNTARATVSGTGVVSGITTGAITISYTAAGCSGFFPMTVNQTPAAISGPSSVCSGSTLSLSETSTGGTWSSSSTANATVTALGVVTGFTPGSANIIYTLPGGCNMSHPITVNITPAPISGTVTVCTGNTVTLSESTGGGSWSSSNTALATVGTATGVVSGDAPGAVIVSYATPSGCSSSYPMTVNQTPAAIAGASSVCSGHTITLTDTNPGGAWSSSNTAVVTVGGGTGIASGIAPGTAGITYTLTGGCNTSVTVTVNLSPAAITGPSSVCSGSSVTLSETTTGGAWSSSNAAIASTTGSDIITGVSAGMASIIYTLPAGCTASYPFTVNPVPAPIAGTELVCLGYSVTLVDGVSGGTWTSSATPVATIGASSGTITGVTAGSATVTYTLPAGCYLTVPVTVSSSLPLIGGPDVICLGNTATLTNTTPLGTWTSSNPSLVSINPSTGLIAGLSPGPVTITYALGACQATLSVTADPAPPPVTGGPNVCLGASVTLSDLSPAGTWSSSNPSVAVIGSVTGIVTGISAGSATITYILSPGCNTTTLVNVQSLPAAIAGPAHICVGNTATYADASPGGSWSSTNPMIAPISFGGVATGIGGGLDTIVYTLPTGCSITRALPVISVPLFTGLDTVCAFGDTVTIRDSNTTGLYTSSLVTVTNELGGNGLVYGHSAGIATITYTVPEGCYVTETLTVYPLPGPITGSYNVCAGGTSLVTDPTSGGIWSISNHTIASLDSFSGTMTGIAAGTFIVTYTLPTGCIRDTFFTVTPPPSAITGTPGVCLYATELLTDPVSGGTWSSSIPAVATVSGSGLLTGVSAGVTTITYSIGSGCLTTRAITVNPLPSEFVTVGGGGFCAGDSGTHVWLNGSQIGVNYQLYNGLTTIGTTMTGTGMILDFGLQTTAGTYTVLAENPSTTCHLDMSGSAVVNVLPLPAPFTLTGGGIYCAGGSGVHIGLSGSQTGVNYQLYFGTTTFGSPFAGTGSAIDFGLIAIAGTYKVIATNTTTTCVGSMADTVNITVSPIVSPALTLSTLHDTVCAGTLVTVSSTATNGGTAPAYQWKLNGVNTGTGLPVYTYVPSNGDVVSVILTSNAACINPDTVSSSLIFNVEPVPSPVVVISASPGTAIAPGQAVTFTASVTGSGTYTLSYQWLLNGSAIAGANASTYTTSSLNNGDVVTCDVTATGPCGSPAANSSVTITVNRTGVATINQVSDILVIPNPNKGDFTVRGSLINTTDHEVVLILTDVLGQEIYKNKVIAIGGKLDVTISAGINVADGTYLLSVYSSEENKVFHIVIEK